MKTFQLSVLFILISAQIFAANEIQLRADLKEVKVFLAGAELTHSVKAKVSKGISDIVIENLASDIDENSIQVSAKGDAVIMSVVKRVDYLRSDQLAPEIRVLEDSLETLEYISAQKNNGIKVLEAEQDMILSNKILSGKDKVVTAAELQKMAEFYRKRLTEVKGEILNTQKELKEILKDITRIKRQLTEINQKKDQPVNQIVVTVSSNASTRLNLQLTYLTNTAGWKPSYDIRVENTSSPATLNYKGNVWQNTGIDWDDISIVLSTRNPRHSGTKPELYTWFIDFYKDYKLRDSRTMGALKKEGNYAASPNKIMLEESETMADYITVVENQLAVEFVPALKYTIPADRKPHIVALHEYKLPANYEHFCAPKLDSDAFLIAYVTDWSEYNLLPGQANIYFENSYVGQSFINPAVAEDTLTLSLGRDKNVIVSRKLLKDFTEDKFFSNDIERIFAYEITVRNNKKNKINLTLEDQIPISQNEDIEVNLIDRGGAKFDSVNGKLKWKLEVDPSKTQKDKFIFSVRHPQNRRINL